jgi:hypothetical protein
MLFQVDNERSKRELSSSQWGSGSLLLEASEEPQMGSEWAAQHIPAAGETRKRVDAASLK